ncbi:hypothetical protein IWW38_001429, partial [Coemansia aciculifera]
EAWVVLATAIGKLQIEDGFQFARSRIYNDNRWRLTWVENRFGCCGFKSAKDMPSSKQCIADLGRVDGCLSPLRQHAAHLNALALVWTVVTILIQAFVITTGSMIYRQASNSEGWLVEELNGGDVEEEGEEDPVGRPNTPTAQFVTFAAGTVGNDNGASSGAWQQDDPQQQSQKGSSTTSA